MEAEKASLKCEGNSEMKRRNKCVPPAANKITNTGVVPRVCLAVYAMF